METVRSSLFPRKGNWLISSPSLYPKIGSTLYEMNWEFLICMLYPSYILFCFVYLMRQIGGEELRRVAGAGSCNVLLLFCSYAVFAYFLKSNISAYLFGLVYYVCIHCL